MGAVLFVCEQGLLILDRLAENARRVFSGLEMRIAAIGLLQTSVALLSGREWNDANASCRSSI
jgi:hypothetical protein